MQRKKQIINCGPHFENGSLTYLGRVQDSEKEEARESTLSIQGNKEVKYWIAWHFPHDSAGSEVGSITWKSAPYDWP